MTESERSPSAIEHSFEVWARAHVQIHRATANAGPEALSAELASRGIHAEQWQRVSLIWWDALRADRASGRLDRVALLERLMAEVAEPPMASSRRSPLEPLPGLAATESSSPVQTNASPLPFQAATGDRPPPSSRRLEPIAMMGATAPVRRVQGPAVPFETRPKRGSGGLEPSAALASTAAPSSVSFGPTLPFASRPGGYPTRAHLDAHPESGATLDDQPRPQVRVTPFDQPDPPLPAAPPPSFIPAPDPLEHDDPRERERDEALLQELDAPLPDPPRPTEEQVLDELRTAGANESFIARVVARRAAEVDGG